MKTMIRPLLSLVALTLGAGMGAAQAAPDWSKVPKRTIQVFHPGVTPIEWTVSKGEHGGATGLRKGETCAGCHEDAGELNLDLDRLATPQFEPAGGPATKMFPVAVQAAYDDKQLHLRFSFKPPVGTKVKGDLDNALKVTVLWPDDKVTANKHTGTQLGCWATCHDDLRTMPAPKGNDKKTKWVESGGYSLMQWASKDNKVSDGSIGSERLMSGGASGAAAEASSADGTQVVTFTRNLPAQGKAVTFGFAIHADHAAGRFHHVSLNYTVGIGADGDVKAQKL